MQSGRLLSKLVVHRSAVAADRVPWRGIAATASSTPVGGISSSIPPSTTPPPLTNKKEDLHHQNRRRHYFSSHARFAAVDHSHAYETNWQGRHGRQLALAQLEGVGKDDPPFDPFSDDEDEDDDEDYESGDEDKDDQSTESDPVTVNDDDDDGDDDLFDGKALYNTDGSLRRTKAERAILRAGSPAGGLFAILELAGSQYKVTTDDLLIVNRLPHPPFVVGSTHYLDSVLLAGSSHMTLVGMPHVPGALVQVQVEEITKDAKVIVFRKRRRKNWKRKNGFRRHVTMLRILDIVLPPAYAQHRRIERALPGTLQNSPAAELL